jgi:hypothetical protein
MHVRAAAWRRAIGDEPRAIERDSHQRRLGIDGSTSGAGALRDMPCPMAQDETSDSQLIARWRSRARSPMSIPVAVAT